MIGKLYLITNTVNNKKYVGKTYQEVETRFKQHVSDSIRERNKNRPLYRAMRKYGVENFTVELIGSFEEQILEEMEVKYIEYYDTYKNGYNATLGGDGAKYLNLNTTEIVELYKSGETVREIAEKNKCCYDTILHLLKINGIDTRKHVVGVRIVELNMSFKSVKDCVAYMIENEYVSEGHNQVASEHQLEEL